MAGLTLIVIYYQLWEWRTVCIGGAHRMHVGNKYRWQDPRYLRYLTLVVGLTAVNIWLWARIVVDATNQVPMGSTRMLLVALGSVIALSLAVSIWRNPPSEHRKMLAVPALRHALATHHAGHIVAAHSVDPTRLRRTSLTGPCNHHSPDTPVITERALRGEMIIALGGMVAEETFSGESGSHSGNDLVRATNIAAAMVGRYGMTPHSPISVLPASRSRRSFFNRVLDDPRTRKDLDSLLRDVKRDTLRKILEERHVVIAVRDALLHHKHLTPAQLRLIISQADKRRHDEDTVLVDLRVVGSNRSAGAAF